MAKTLVDLYPGIARIIEQKLDCVAVYGNTETDSIKLVVFAHNLERVGLVSDEATVAKIFCSPESYRVTLKFGDISRKDRAKLYRFSNAASKYGYVHTSFVAQMREMGLDSSYPHYFPVEAYSPDKSSLSFICDPQIARALSKKYDLQAGMRAEEAAQEQPDPFRISSGTLEKFDLLGIDLTRDGILDKVLDYAYGSLSDSLDFLETSWGGKIDRRAVGE
jgi:hypothetical protein